MKRLALLAVAGLWVALYMGCGKDTGTNTGGIHDTLTVFTYDTIFIHDSTGGMVWTVRPGIPNNGYPNINSLIWGGNLFVAVGSVSTYDSIDHYYGKVFTSPDGIAWTERTPGTIPTLYQVTWAKNTFVAVGDSGTIITSSNGITWSRQTSGTGNFLPGVVYGANKFLAWCGGDSLVLTSADGNSWTLDTANISIYYNYSEIAWGNNRFVMAADSIYTSTDGLTWTNTGVSVGYKGSSIIWADSQFVVASVSNIFTSPDGISWTNRGWVSNSGVGGIAWGNGKFVISNGDCNLTSLDGIIWNVENGLSNSTWLLAYGAGKFVAMKPNAGVVLTSQW